MARGSDKKQLWRIERSKPLKIAWYNGKGTKPRSKET